MSQFEVSLIHRLADDLENVAKSMKQQVNSPTELQHEISKINSIVGSLQNQLKAANQSEMNPLIDDNQVR